MKLLKLTLAFTMVLSLAACGHTVKETVSPVPADQVGTASRNVVVIPFADYTPNSSRENYWRRNVLIMEALQDEFSRYGVATAIEEDVLDYLVREKIIELPEDEPVFSMSNAYMHDMAASGDWSSTMVRELATAIDNNRKLDLERQKKETGDERAGTLSSTSLTSEQVVHLGYMFGANYIVRGRIVEFDQGAAKDNFNPFQVGLLPFVFNTGQRTIFGVAQSDKYEMIDKMAIGGIAGLAYGNSNRNTPFDQDVDHEDSGHPLFSPAVIDIDDYHELNTAFWGAAGTGLAFLAHKGGKVPRAVVQIRVMVQDAATGRLVWSNRSQIEVTPGSVFSPQEYRVLVDRAIREAAGSLVGNFITACEPELAPAPEPAAGPREKAAVAGHVPADQG
ncbi:MAG: hypothetical protein JW781_08305 [Deltaproteobacteria bacterium]|nr:hypothetical protein [Candidatus Anaeroferrophillacea bacterium]